MLPLFTLLSVLALTGADQLIKYIVTEKLRDGAPLVLIPHVLQLHYTENDGAMMGLLQGKTTLMAVLALAVFAVLLYLVFSKKIRFGLVYCCLAGILAGGLGNLLDRIFRGFVVDYIEVLFVKFYIFNFADCLITVGAFLIIFYELYELIRDSRRKKEEAHG
ncbi:MAG: signal peptidase II [Clostridia bacterium]|nr:signal peptidase II [Clostridia bacterium]